MRDKWQIWWCAVCALVWCQCQWTHVGLCHVKKIAGDIKARPGIKHVMWSFTSLQFWCKLCPQLKPSNLYQNCRLIGNFAIKQQICQYAIVTNFDMLLLFARGSLLSGLLLKKKHFWNSDTWLVNSIADQNWTVEKDKNDKNDFF